MSSRYAGRMVRLVRALVLTVLLASTFSVGAEASSPDGTWSSISSPEARASHAAVVDGARHRMIVVCGRSTTSLTGTSDVWALSIGGTPVWSLVATNGTPPPARYGHTLVFDAAHDRVLLMGGFNGTTIRNDVWALSLDTFTWSEIAPSGSLPSPRWGHTAVVDPAGDRMLVLGGQTTGGALLGDVWQLPLAPGSSWSPLSASGTAPSARRGATASFDAPRRRVVLFGGLGPGFKNDVWSLSLSGAPAWSALTPAGAAPAPRAFHSAAADESGDRIVVMGGTTGSVTNEVWELSLSGGGVWTLLAPSGSAPTSRSNHSGIFDAAANRMIVFGGAAASMLGDLWELSMDGSPTWQAIPASPLTLPSNRRDAASALDPVRHRIVGFGGANGTQKLSDAWVQPLSPGLGIEPLATSGTPPSPRLGATAAYDPLRDRMLFFGGIVTTNPGVNEVWALSMGSTPTWSLLTATGTPPSGRALSAVIYDPLRDRLVVYGGLGNGWYDDVWELTLSGTPQWQQLAPGGDVPSGRSQSAFVYDAARDRLVVWGGQGAPTQLPPPDLGAAWALSFSPSPTWQMLTQSGYPSMRYGMVTGYDAARDRMLFFGGADVTSFLDETWEFSLAGSGQWRQLSPDGPRPRRRLGATGTYDPATRSLVVIGGMDAVNGNPAYLGDAFALLDAGVLSAPPPDARHAGLALSAPRPNPAGAGGTTIEYSLPSSGPISLRVYDVNGRRVATLTDGEALAGSHRAHWDARGVPAGIYFCELRAAGGARTVRLALTR